jgi:hypothetical protein
MWPSCFINALNNHSLVRPAGLYKYGSQASENIALTRGDGLAMLHCISITAAHNIVGLANASWGKFFLVLLQALEHIVCQHRHAAALFLKFFAAR